MRKALLPLMALLWSGAALADDNAGVFFRGPPPTVAQVTALAEGAEVTSAPDGNRTRVRVSWPGVSLILTIDPTWPRDLQIAGMRGWISRFPADEQGTPEVKAFLAALNDTTTCYGTVISPGYDAGGKVAGFLQRLLGTQGGFFFTHQSFYDAKGNRIIGSTTDPAVMGPR
jgi:hypothetical protein